MSVTVATFNGVLDAQLARAFIESRGIPCFLADEHIVSVHPFYSSAVGGVKLNVHPEHAEAALELYLEFKQGAHAGTVVPDCPRCGSDEVLPLPPLPAVYYNEFRCFACDHEWDDRYLHHINPGHIE